MSNFKCPFFFRRMNHKNHQPIHQPMTPQWHPRGRPSRVRPSHATWAKLRNALPPPRRTSARSPHPVMLQINSCWLSNNLRINEHQTLWNLNQKSRIELDMLFLLLLNAILLKNDLGGFVRQSVHGIALISVDLPWPLALNGTSALSRLLKLFTKMSKLPGLMMQKEASA